MLIKGRSNPPPQATQEFLLVVVMLTALVALIFIILALPTRIDGISNDTTEILNYRKDNLAVILAAFGAWIGAGAAYFFSRESLKQTSESILSMREPSTREKLQKVSLRNASPPSLGWVVTADDNIQTVKDKLKYETKRWFVIVLRKDRTLEQIVHEDAFWRFIDEQYTEGIEGQSYEQILGKKVSDVLKYIDKQSDELKKDLMISYVLVKMDTTAFDADNLMRNRGSYLAIIINAEGKPTNFITRDNINEFIRKIG